MTVQVHSIGHGVHPVGSLAIANYALNPSMEIPDSTVAVNARINLCTNPTFETGTTGWTTSGSTPPTIGVSIANRYLGSQSCKVTCNGSASFTNSLSYISSGLTIGNTYTFSAYVYLPTGFTGSVGCGLSGGTFGSASSTIGSWGRISITATATATTHTWFIYSNTYTTGQSFYVDAVMLENSSTLKDYFDGSVDRFISRTNLCTNPSFETGTSSWATGGSVAPTFTTSNAKKIFGTQSGLITWPATGSLPLIDYSFTTTVGAIYTVSAFVYVPTGSPSVLLTVAGFSFAGQISSVTNDWQRLSYVFVATATTSHLQIITTSPGVGTCYVDGVLIEKGSGLGNYFDGSLPSFSTTGVAQAWTGTAHASSSTQMIPVGMVAWNGTANASASTRWDTGVKWWIQDNSTVTQVANNRDRGMYSAQMVPNTTSLMPKMSQTFNVIDSTNYSVSLSVFIPATITGGGLTMEFRPYDITNTLIQGPDTTPLLLTGNPTTGFVRVATTYMTPAGTVTLTIAIRPTNQPSSTSDVIFIDNVLVEQADTSSALYIDGDAAGYVWSGVKGESVTLQTEFPDALNFFGTVIWQKFTQLVIPADGVGAENGALVMGGHATLHETPWSPVPLTD